MKEIRERWLHLNMTLIGGFLGGYAILNYSDLFGSAQTANLISITIDAFGRSDANQIFRIAALLIYMAGMALTVILPKIMKINLKLFSICLDTAAIILISCFPKSLNPYISLFPIFLATSIQWCSFDGADGYKSSCIFSTNNLRQFTTSFTEYFCSKDREALRKGKFFGKVLLCFHAGAALSYISCQQFDRYGAFICLIPLASALLLAIRERIFAAVPAKHSAAE